MRATTRQTSSLGDCQAASAGHAWTNQSIGCSGGWCAGERLGRAASGHESAEEPVVTHTQGHKGFTTHIRSGQSRQEVNKHQQGNKARTGCAGKLSPVL